MVLCGEERVAGGAARGWGAGQMLFLHLECWLHRYTRAVHLGFVYASVCVLCLSEEFSFFTIPYA